MTHANPYLYPFHPSDKLVIIENINSVRKLCYLAMLRLKLS